MTSTDHTTYDTSVFIKESDRLIIMKFFLVTK